MIIVSIFPEKNKMQRNNANILMFVCKYMKSHKNDILDFCDITHAQLRIYREFYHYIIYIANEGRHFRTNNKSRTLSFCQVVIKIYPDKLF